MKSSTEYIKESETYAKNRLARFKEKFGDNYLECSDETAIFLLKDGYMDGAMQYDYKKYKLIEKAISLWKKHILKADITVEEFEQLLRGE